MLIFDIAKDAIDQGIKTLADIRAPLNSTVDKGEINTWCNSTIPSPSRYNVLTKSALGLQSYANLDGNFMLLTSVGTDYINGTQDEATTFSLGNNWHTTVPHYVTKLDVVKFFISILPQGLADDTTFTQLTVDLNTVAPSTVNGTPQGGAERFNLEGYDALIDDTHPVAVVVPVIFKLPYGHGLPATVGIDSFDVNAEIFTKGGNTEGWIRAMKWANEHNAGASLHHATMYLNNTALPITGALAPLLTDRCDIRPITTMLPHDATGNHESVTTRIQDAIVLAAQKGGVSSPGKTGTPNAPTGTTVTQTEQRTNEKSEQRMNKLRLLLVGEDDKGVLVIPELARHITEAFKETTPVKAAVVLAQAFRDYRSNVVKKILGSRGGSFSLNTDQMYPRLTKELMDCNWFTENLTYNPSALLNDLTIFAFLKANVECSTFHEIVKHGQKIMSDVEMAPSNKNISPGSPNLYTKGNCTKVADGLSALSNLEGMLSFFLADPTKHVPLISKYLQRSYDRLDNMETKSTLEAMCDGTSPNRYFIPNFLSDINQGVSHFAAFAQSYEARTALEKKDPLLPFMETTINNVSIVETNMSSMLASGKFGDMNNMPALYKYIAKVGAPVPTPPQEGRYANNNDVQTPKAKKQKQQGTPAAAVANGNNSQLPNSKKGIIKNAEGKTGMPQLPNGIKAIMPNRDNALGQPCNKHIMDGVACTIPNCRYAHVNKNNFHKRIPDKEHQKMFCDYVNNNPNFTWANGTLTPQSQ